MRLIALFIFLMLLPLPATAGSWLKSCDSGRTTTGLSPGQFACYQPASNSDTSVLLNVSACENVDALYFLDRNGDTTASTVSVTVQSCPASITSCDTDACFVVENVTLDGDESTSTEAIYGFKAAKLCVVLPGSGTIADPELDIHCNGPH